VEPSYWNRVLMERLTRRRLLAGAGAIAAGAAVAACGGSDGGDAGGDRSGRTQAVYGGTLRIAIGGEPRNIDPASGSSGGENVFFYPLCDPLIGYDQNGLPTAALSLAESWDFPEPTRIVLKIRNGVKFQDGTEFTAEDVKWNLERHQDPRTASMMRPALEVIRGIEVPGKYEAVIHLSEPNASLIANLGDRAGQMVSPTAFARIGSDQFKRNPVGTGPFRLKEWTSDANMVYERNPEYWRKDAGGGALPYLDTIRFEVIPDATVRTAALESGQVDLGPVPASDAQRVQSAGQLQWVDFIGSSTSIWYVNHAFPPLDNVWFRRAFASALDTKSYTRNFLTGDEPLATGFLQPPTWAHDPNIKNYTYDKAKVREYLQRSGLPQSAWRIKTQPFGAQVSEAEQYWEANLKDEGITLEWAQPERDGWAKRVLKGVEGDGSTGLYVSGYVYFVDPDVPMTHFFTQRGTYNPGLAPTPETEPLVVKARQTYDVNERKKLYSDVQRLGLENVYSQVPMWYNITRTFASKRVGNLELLYGGDAKALYHNLWIS
jgi:peptide/nickel transport system substrate-binding protein